MHGIYLPWWLYAAFAVAVLMVIAGVVFAATTRSQRRAARLLGTTLWLVVWTSLAYLCGATLWIFGGWA